MAEAAIGVAQNPMAEAAIGVARNPMAEAAIGVGRIPMAEAAIGVARNPMAEAAIGVARSLMVNAAMANVTNPPMTTNLLYYRLMLPNWLRQNATWNCTYKGNDLALEIESDSSDWENIFKVDLLPPGALLDDADITIMMTVGATNHHHHHHQNNMSYMITDGDFAMGIQLLDPNQDYATYGPYRAVEGDVAKTKLRNPNTNVASTVSTSSTNNPDQFEMQIKPSEAWGSAYCAIDDGYKIVAQYSDCLKLSKGLKFELYRYKSTERHIINYIEVSVKQDSPKVPLVKQNLVVPTRTRTRVTEV